MRLCLDLLMNLIGRSSCWSFCVLVRRGGWLLLVV